MVARERRTLENTNGPMELDHMDQSKAKENIYTLFWRRYRVCSMYHRFWSAHRSSQLAGDAFIVYIQRQCQLLPSNLYRLCHSGSFMPQIMLILLTISLGGRCIAPSGVRGCGDAVHGVSLCAVTCRSSPKDARVVRSTSSCNCPQ